MIELALLFVVAVFLAGTFKAAAAQGCGATSVGCLLWIGIGIAIACAWARWA